MPTLTSPADAAVSQPLTLTFTWSSDSGATSYQIQIGRDGAFLAPDLDRVVAGTSLNLAAAVGDLGYPLDFGTAYFWRVRSFVGQAPGAWSTVRSFSSLDADLAFTPETDHVGAGQAQLLQQFQGTTAPRLKAFNAILLKQVQLLENAAQDVLISHLLAYAQGAQLDELGAFVGLSRASLDDSEYRADIQLQIYANNSSGNPEELAYIAQQLTGATAVRYEEVGPGSFRLYFTGGTFFTGLLATLQRLCVGGVRILGIHHATLRRFKMTDRVNQALLHE